MLLTHLSVFYFYLTKFAAKAKHDGKINWHLVKRARAIDRCSSLSLLVRGASLAHTIMFSVCRSTTGALGVSRPRDSTRNISPTQRWNLCKRFNLFLGYRSTSFLQSGRVTDVTDFCDAIYVKRSRCNKLLKGKRGESEERQSN